MQQILHQIRAKGDDSFRGKYDVTLCIRDPSHQLDSNLNAEQSFHPRIFKHHEPFGEIKTSDLQKIIVIIRDPYDAAFSLVKYISGFCGDTDDLNDDETLQFMMSKNFNTIASWWEHRDDPTLLFLFYEDLKHDLEFMIKKISDFVQIPLNDEELRRVCYLSSFEYMSKHKDMFLGDDFVEQMSKALGIEKWIPAVGTVRADGGKVGDGLNKLRPEIRAMVDKLWEQIVGRQCGVDSYQALYKQRGIFAKK